MTAEKETGWVTVTLRYPIQATPGYLDVQTDDPSPDAAGMTHGTWHRTHGTWCAGNIIEELERLADLDPDDPLYADGCLCHFVVRPVTVTRERPEP